MVDDERLGTLIGSFKDIPIVDMDGYHYFVHPLSDGIRMIDPGLLRDIVGPLEDLIKEMGGCDLLLTVESMGIPVTTAVSMRTGIPFNIVRKRAYGLQGEVESTQVTGYSRTTLHMDLPEGKGNIILIDDVLSTGGTIKAVAEGIERTEWSISGIIFLFNKMGEQSKILSEEIGIPIRSLLDVEINERSCSIRPSRN